MSTKHLISELLESPSVFEDFRKLFDIEFSIPNIKTSEDVSQLLSVRKNLRTVKFASSRAVNVSIMDVHSRVMKPYVNKQDTDEDDFI